MVEEKGHDWKQVLLDPPRVALHSLMPLDQRAFDTSYNHRSLIDKIPNTSISKTRSRSPSPTRNSSPPRLPPMAPSPLEAQRASGGFVNDTHSREHDKRLVPNWLLNEVRGGDPRASVPLRPPAWKGVFPSPRDDDSRYPMPPPPPSSYPFSLAPSKPRPIVGYPPVNINSYKGYDYPSSSSSSYPGTRSAYPEHYPSDPYRSESPHSAAYSPPKYIKEESIYRRESERYSPQRMDYPPPPLPPRHYDAPPPIRRSPPGIHPDSYRSEHIPHSMYIDHHMPPRPEYPYDPYARHYESPLSTSIRRTEITRSADSDARIDRRAMWDQRRSESSPDFSSDPYLHEEGVYERQSDMYRRSDARRHELAAKLSPPSPTTSSRPYSPYESHPYQSAYPPKPRASPFPAERRSRSPSPHRSDPHNHSTPNPSPTPTASAPTATPAPIFTMESPGGFSIGADGKAAAPHPKNPVKFEFKDFKENEYNLHSLQNSGGNTSLLSLKQQKRHKRIINRALAQGQARARARATQPENSDSPQGDDKAMHEGHKQHHADRVLEERKTKRATRLPSPSSPSSSSASSASDSDLEPVKSNKRKSIEDKELEEFLPEGEEQDPKKPKRILQTSGGCVIEQFETYEELHQDMVKPVTRASTRLRTRTLSGNVISGKIHCICNRPETDSMVQCDSCDKWFHLECVGMNESSAQEIMAYFCAECRSRGSLTKKARIEDLIAESDQPSSTRSPSDSQSSSSDQSSILSPKTSDDMDEDDDDEDLPAGDDDTIQIGDGVVSISSLAKQPWLDGWVTARSFAVRYLKEAKRLGHEISSNRRLPKQVAVRNSGKVKSWRQAEVLLAIQFLKSSDLVETSTKKGTLVREPCRTMDDLISRAQTVEMPNRGNIGKVKVVEFARQRNQPQIIPQQQHQQQQSITMGGDRDEKKEMTQ